MNSEPKSFDKERTTLTFLIQITRDLTYGTVELILPTHPFMWRVEQQKDNCKITIPFDLKKWMRLEKLRKGTLYVIF